MQWCLVFNETNRSGSWAIIFKSLELGIWAPRPWLPLCVCGRFRAIGKDASCCVWALSAQTKPARSSSHLVSLMSGDRRSSRQCGGRRMLQSKILWLADCPPASQMHLGVSRMPQRYRHVSKRPTPVLGLFSATHRLWARRKTNGRGGQKLGRCSGTFPDAKTPPKLAGDRDRYWGWRTRRSPRTHLFYWRVMTYCRRCS